MSNPEGYQLRRHIASFGALIALGAPVIASVAMGCGSQGGDTPAGLTLGGSGGATGSSSSGASSGAGGWTVITGTPCSPDGVTRACGHVTHQQGIYLECAVGSQTCVAGTWGDCVIDKFATAIAPPQSGDSPLNLQVDAGPCTNNPCDPACLAYSDTPSDVDAGPDSGLILDGGVTLQGVVGSSASLCTGLTATPASVDVVVKTIPASAILGPITYTATPGTQYTASFIPAGCYVGPVPALWTVDKPGISTISATGLFNLVGPIPGVIHVTAYSGSWSTAPLPVNVTVDAVDVTNAPGAYTNASFTAGSGADNITVLYPYNNTVLPLAQLAPIIQWDNGGTAANAVRVQLRYPAGTGALFKWSGVLPESQTTPTPTLAAQPRAFIPQTVWTAFEQAAKGGIADFVIQRIVGGTVRLPNAPVNLHFATDQLKGTVYYQSYGTNLATNYSGALKTGGGTKNFGAATLAIKAGAVAPVLVAGDNNNCRVCHSVASSGKALVTQSPTNGDNDSWFYDLGTLAQTDMGPTSGGDGQYAFAAVSPDGTYLFSNSGPLSGSYSNNNSSLFSIPSKAPIAATGLPAIQARTPSFSPDAAHVAFQLYGGGCAAGATSCTKGSDCCSGSCNTACSANAASCAANSDCCSNVCQAYKAAGGACAVNGDCASNLCTTYKAGGAACAANAECNSNVCTSYKAGGVACAANAECTSMSCASYKGANVVCSANTDCDSNSCVACKGNGAGACTVANQATTCCSGVCNGGTGKCTGSNATGKMCSGGVASNKCNGGVASSTCTGGVATSTCTGGVAKSTCTGGVAGKLCTGGGAAAADAKSLASIDYNPATTTFSNVQVLATPGAALGGGPAVGAGTIYFPYYLPGSTGIVWNLETVYNGRDPGGTRSQCDGIGCSSNNEGAHGELWWTDVASKKSARLDQLNGVGLPTHATAVIPGGDNQLNYEPTVLPQTAGGYAWVVFTSRRLYGNIATINPFWSDPRFQTIDEKPTTKKLWVAAIDLEPGARHRSQPPGVLSARAGAPGGQRARVLGARSVQARRGPQPRQPLHLGFRLLRRGAMHPRRCTRQHQPLLDRGRGAVHGHRRGLHPGQPVLRLPRQPLRAGDVQGPAASRQLLPGELHAGLRRLPVPLGDARGLDGCRARGDVAGQRWHVLIHPHRRADGRLRGDARCGDVDSGR